jgi:Flp pilus assembly protein TadG
MYHLLTQSLIRQKVSACCRQAGARFFKARSGAVSVMFAVSLLALVPAIGIAVDYARVVQFKTALQNAADNAALAGASAYTGASLATTGQTTAATYMTKSIATLPANNGVTSPTPTTSTVTYNSAVTGYTVTVAATGSISTTFMSPVMASMTASVTATAENPIRTVTINSNSLQTSSDAADHNIVYMYAVPLDNSVPTTSNLKLIYDNDPKQASSNPSSVTLTVAASQNVGFALKNVTGGLSGYGKNGYGGAQGSTHWMYSHLSPPSSKAYTSVTQNCLIETKDTTSNTNDLGSAPSSGSCFSKTPGQYTQNLALDCTKNAGKVIRYYWNDMGGTSDDHDYNDAAYNVTCPTDGIDPNGPTGVALIR